MTTVRLLAICEDQGHWHAATVFVDRCAVKCVDWIEPETVQHLREWIPDGSFEFVKLTTVSQRAPRSYGHFGGEKALPEARQFHKAMLLAWTWQPRPDAVVVLRDLDGKPERLEGFEQARRERSWPFEVVLGAPSPEVEAWQLAGFHPEDERETEIVVELRAELGFSPIEAPHRVPPKRMKVVADRLGTEDRRYECLKSDFEVLRERGREAGLESFLDALEVRVVPLLTRSRR